MKLSMLIVILSICSTQLFYSQEDDGVVSLAIPTRNSLTFNRYTINPTFSFVREQTKFISIYNKREWVQFEDAPLTYLASYSGRFGENIGAGLGLFQQNYGVLTTFGGILNFAYNARLAQDSNLTFGLNIAAYRSGVNTSNVVTNFDDPALQNVPENFLLTINPGINYGTEFLDFGVSISNLALYNFESSELIQDNPEQGIQAHIMYTGYMDSRGFFDESKFSGLLRSEFLDDETIISGLAMITVPKGIWAQAGYNTLYGASGGVGINITSQVAIEYNFETALGDLSNFGPSHEITLAYRFKNREYYRYSSEDEVSSIFSTDNRRRRRRVSNSSRTRPSNRKPTTNTVVDNDVKDDAELIAQQKAQEEAEAAQAKLIAEQEAKAQEEEARQAQILAEQKVKEEAQAKLEADLRAKEIAETRARIRAQQKAKEEAEAEARALAAQKVQEEAKRQAQLLAEEKAQEEAEARARALEAQKAQEEADRQAQLLAEQKAREEAEEKARLLAEQKAQEEADRQAQLLAEQQAQEDLIENPQDVLGKSMKELTQLTEDSNAAQNELLKQFDDIVTIKDDDLKALKEENDLSDQGITVEPRPFKSVTAENNTLNNIMSNLDTVIKTQNDRIEELSALYDERSKVAGFTADEVNLFYKKEIKRLEAEQLKATQTRALLSAKLEQIRVATEFEKRRRIKRAAYDNEQDQYAQDRAALKNIKETTALSSTALKTEDFDFGEERGSSIKILKNIKNVDNGYYMIIAVHSDRAKRNDFVQKVVASGRSDVDFFHDVNTSKYYIYYDKFDSIELANEAIKTKGDRPYNGKMSIVKIEN